jgi:hypothetical protein
MPGHSPYLPDLSWWWNGEALQAHSPDRSVLITATWSGDVGVELTDLSRHTEASLARQVAAAARVALASLQHAATNTADQTTEPQRERW